MNRFTFLLLLSFIGSVASIFASRGVYFYTFREFGFGDAANLWLALGTGLAYILGALPSHHLALRFGERRVMFFAIIMQTLCLGAMFAFPSPWVIITGQISFSLFNAIMWPIVESYVSAGRSPRETARAIGRFNITWALSVPLAVLFTGPIIAQLKSWLFGIGALCLIAVGFLAFTMKPKIDHMAHDHPDRPPAARLHNCRELLHSSWWLLAYTYSLFLLLAPLFPRLFDRLGYDVDAKTALASIVDFARWTTFVAMQFWTGWHDRPAILWLAIVLLPTSFLIVLVVPQPVPIILAEIIFGIAAGLVYYAALYYAMVVKNASVDAGGAHEGLIGVGYSVGPAAGLVAFAIGGPQWNESPTALLIGIGPLILICTIGAVRPLLRLRKTNGNASPRLDHHA